MIRKPAVEGAFYPSDTKKLNEAVKAFINKGSNRNRKATGVVSPHAGYVYSGKTAGMVFSEVSVPDRVILIGPNHTGLGVPVSVMTEGEWEIGGKKVPVDNETAQQILKFCRFAQSDFEAHLSEHSLEVQLPFLLFKNPDLKFVPVVLATFNEQALEELGEAVAHTIEDAVGDVLIVASSDMSHYVTEETARKKDQLAIEQILKLDWKGLIEVVEREDISMCGAAPVAVMLKAAQVLLAEKAQVINYTTSAEASGDTSQVVGYAGIKVF